MTVTAAFLLAVLVGSPAATPEVPRPRFAAGASGAIAHIEGGSGEHDETLSIGLFAAWRARRFLALAARYSRAPITHNYSQVRFQSSYHRLALAPEARLPIGRRFDFFGWVGPEVMLLRSSLWAENTAERASTRAYLGVGCGGGAAVRIGAIELRTEVAIGLRDDRVDRAFVGSVLWIWP